MKVHIVFVLVLFLFTQFLGSRAKPSRNALCVITPQLDMASGDRSLCELLKKVRFVAELPGQCSKEGVTA